MSYITQSNRASVGSIAAVVAIHAGVGALLVFGLTVSGAMPDIITRLPAKDIRDVPPPPPPPPPPENTADPKESTVPPVFTPVPKLDLKPTPPIIDTTNLIPPPIPSPQPGRGEIVLPKPAPPAPTPSFEPVPARPKNDPGRWLSNNDYRSSWARRELTGVARFRLEIAANGRVSNCTVTGSTGHSELDAATCSLVSKRARFEPARGGNGEPVAGSYTGSVLWQLPE
ncbi:energy transducer TonB [Qipengyuania sp. XHP0211]|uniref:energy transducer TonB n=1 Tax=Qipengyuania sp. XHP0211 TaxID=3038079 RepID=UPI00241C310A|nr:energy transducer TonB [Qipengyuania sp. XHP0211]MDG5749882.1 energy transducer TonB [Qipengyuania sp. XHP0211]